MNIAIEPSQVAVAQGTQISGPLFILRVSRPGLWATTALFYLMLLGREFHWRSAGFWAGLVYIPFPLGLLLFRTPVAQTVVFARKCETLTKHVNSDEGWLD